MNGRPAFLTRPYDWTLCRRTAQTRVDYACAVEPPPRRRPWHPAETVFMVGFAAFVAALLGGWI